MCKHTQNPISLERSHGTLYERHACTQTQVQICRSGPSAPHMSTCTHADVWKHSSPPPHCFFFFLRWILIGSPGCPSTHDPPASAFYLPSLRTLPKKLRAFHVTEQKCRLVLGSFCVLYLRKCRNVSAPFMNLPPLAASGSCLDYQPVGFERRGH